MLKNLVGTLVPLLAAVVALAFGATMLLALGASPVEGFSAMFDGAFGLSLIHI